MSTHYRFLSRNKQNSIYPCKSEFQYIKVGFKGVKIIQGCFRDGYLLRKKTICNSETASDRSIGKLLGD